jgi:hypothetical protein
MVRVPDEPRCMRLSVAGNLLVSTFCDAKMTNPLQLGQIVATPAAFPAFEDSAEQPGDFLPRHACGDWADLCEEDRRENEFSLVHAFRCCLPTIRSAPNT